MYQHAMALLETIVVPDQISDLYGRCLQQRASLPRYHTEKKGRCANKKHTVSAEHCYFYAKLSLVQPEIICPHKMPKQIHASPRSVPVVHDIEQLPDVMIWNDTCKTVHAIIPGRIKCQSQKGSRLQF